MSEYLYECHVICPVENAVIGNALAGAIDPDSGGALTFTDAKAIKCYPAGTTFSGSGLGKVPSQPASAYAAFPLLKPTGYARVTEFMSAGPYPLLNALGISNAQIAAGKAALTITAGPRGEIGTGPQFIAGNGYVMP